MDRLKERWSCEFLHYLLDHFANLIYIDCFIAVLYVSLSSLFEDTIFKINQTTKETLCVLHYTKYIKFKLNTRQERFRKQCTSIHLRWILREIWNLCYFFLATISTWEQSATAPRGQEKVLLFFTVSAYKILFYLHDLVNGFVSVMRRLNVVL